jgi:endonuclease/exonuclease/phosphatase family metal-dependent hydrolase
VTFRLLTYNIWLGGQGRVDKLARVIQACHPDLVLLQEATRPDVVEEIARASGMGEWRAAVRQSLGYMSREPVAHASWHRPRFSHHAFVEIVPAGQAFRVFGVHLSAVHSAWTERRRVFELRALLRSVRRHEPAFHVLAGDFNTLAPGATLEARRLPLRLRPLLWATGGRVRWRTVKTVLEAGYVDAFRTLHPAEPGYTMPTWDPHVRLDYAFVPAEGSDRLVACEVVAHADAAAASDHLPVLLEFQVDPVA